MRELRDILAAHHELARTGQAGVLCSIVHAAGSTYRRPGARLLVLPDDEMIGLISGGCLEGDLLEHAARVRASGQPELVHYDASADDDVLWGLGLGCAGVVDVLLELVDERRPCPLHWLGAWREAGRTGALATRLDAQGLGARVALHPDGRVEAGPALPTGTGIAEIGARLRAALQSGQAGRVATPEGDLAVEIAAPPLRLVIFGAGPDAAPVARIAAELGWELHVSDGRPAHARADRFARARVHCVPAEEAVADVGIDARTFALIMTHHYLHDRTLLRDLLPGPAAYVGLLGPKQRALDLLADLAEQGLVATEEQLARLHAPAGLDIGGEGPEAIAVALIAEIQALSQGRFGGWLRERKGPIHEPGRP